MRISRILTVISLAYAELANGSNATEVDRNEAVEYEYDEYVDELGNWKKKKKCKKIYVEVCEDCVALGDTCVNDLGYNKRCKELGYVWEYNKCVKKCPDIYCHTCEDCVALGPDCVADLGYNQKCKKLGYIWEYNKCVPICPDIDINDPLFECADCVKLGPDCVADGGFNKKCKALGYIWEKNKCEKRCPDIYCHTCQDCVKLGPDCVADLGYNQKCKKMGYIWEYNKCIDICPDVEPMVCQDCTEMGPDCVADHGWNRRCRALGYIWEYNKCGKRKCPDIDVHNDPLFECADCVKLGADCVADLGYNKKCKAAGYIWEKNKCEKQCPDIYCHTCEDCVKLGPDCVADLGYNQKCKKLGYVWEYNKCINVCPDVEPMVCQDCTEMGPDCVADHGWNRRCKALGYIWEYNKCGKRKCPDIDVHNDPLFECADCVKLGADCVNDLGYNKKCKAAGYIWEKNKCEKECPDIYCHTCEDCVRLGPDCVADLGYNKKCKALGYIWEYNKCVGCPDIDINDPLFECADCVQMGPDCVADGGFNRKCKALGYIWKENRCGKRLCPDIDVINDPLFECADCVKLGPDCVNDLGYNKKCEAAGYVWKYNTCIQKPCISLHVEICEDCVTLGADCVADMGWNKKCHGLGYKWKENRCETAGKCGGWTPMDKCEDCVEMGADCVASAGWSKKCKSMGYVPEYNACVGGGVTPETCPAPWGLRMYECKDCIQLGAYCVVEMGFNGTCKDLGYVGDYNACKSTPTPSCPAKGMIRVDVCQDCINLGWDCVADMGFNKTCKGLGYDWKNNACKGTGVQTCPAPWGYPTPKQCKDCVDLGSFCVNDMNFSGVCKSLGYVPDANGCKGTGVQACPAPYGYPTPKKCSDCTDLGSHCVEEMGLFDICQGLGYTPAGTSNGVGQYTCKETGGGTGGGTGGMTGVHLYSNCPEPFGYPTPTKCSTCIDLGNNCVEYLGLEDVCQNLGYAPAGISNANGWSSLQYKCNGTNVQKCPAPFGYPTPKKCSDCTDLGSHCVKEMGLFDVCQSLGYTPAGLFNGVGQYVCKEPDEPILCKVGYGLVKKCDECLSFGADYVRKCGYSETCKDLGFNTNSLGSWCTPGMDTVVCPVGVPTPRDCNRCLSLGAECVDRLGFSKTCRDLGMNNTVFGPFCSTNGGGGASDSPAIMCPIGVGKVTKCDRCLSLGADIVQNCGYAKTCKDLGYNTNSFGSWCTPGMDDVVCPVGVPKPRDCERDCLSLGADCVYQLGYAATCTDLGMNTNVFGSWCTPGAGGNGHQNPICPIDHPIPSTCERCLELGADCVSYMGFSNACSNLGMHYNIFGSWCDTTLRPECPGIYGRPSPRNCVEDCMPLGPYCVNEMGYSKICKDLGYYADSKGSGCGKVDTTDCPGVYGRPKPKDCLKDCLPLGSYCVDYMGYSKICAALGYNHNSMRSWCEAGNGGNGGGVDPCPTIHVTTCEACVSLGPKCVTQKGKDKVCKNLGYKSKKNKCKDGKGGNGGCVKKCHSCEECAKQSYECQMKIKYCKKKCLKGTVVG